MKAKYILIYAGLGTAFLAVSLWVLLSGGRSAKAIRAKYRLGGAMLTVWAMLSASNCEGPGLFVTCYDPVMPDPVTYTVQGKEGMEVSSGDVILADCDKGMLNSYVSFRVEVMQGETVLQDCPLVTPLEEDDAKAVYAITLQLPEGTKGAAVLAFYASYVTESGETGEWLLFTRDITIL